jgi:hypothetical protein
MLPLFARRAVYILCCFLFKTIARFKPFGYGFSHVTEKNMYYWSTDVAKKDMHSLTCGTFWGEGGINTE